MFALLIPTAFVAKNDRSTSRIRENESPLFFRTNTKSTIVETSSITYDTVEFKVAKVQKSSTYFGIFTTLCSLRSRNVIDLITIVNHKEKEKFI